MKTAKHIWAMALLACLAAALCLGCTGAAASAGTSHTAPSQASSQPAAEEDPVTVMDCFINMSWYFSDSFEGVIPEAITEKTGVRLRATRAVDDRQLGLMIASGDMPDLIYTDKELDRLSDPELAYAYNELIARYAPEWDIHHFSKINAQSFSQNEDYYFLLNVFSPPEEWEEYPGTPMVSTLAYRADILQALGDPPMETLDDLVEVLRMVKQRYPEMIPLGFHASGTGYRLMIFRVWLGTGSKMFEEDAAGHLSHFIENPNYKEFLRFANLLYREGLMDADNFSLSDPECKALFQQGKCFAYTGYTQGEMYRYGEMAAATDPGARVLESPPLVENPGKHYVDTIGFAGTVITKNNRDPEKAIRFVQYLFSDEGQKLAQWGREGTEWVMGDDGYPVFSRDWLAASQDDNLLYTKYNPAFYFGTSGVIEATGRIAALPAEYRAVYSGFEDMIYYCPWIKCAEPKGGSAEADILKKLDEHWLMEEVPVILSENEEEFERNFDNYYASAKQLGLDSLTEYMNAQVTIAKAIYRW